MPNDQRLLKFVTYLSNCTPEAIGYGNCVAGRAEKIKHRDCEKEFQLLFKCFKKQDEQILEKIKELGGIPSMSIKFNGILLDKPSESSLRKAENSYEEIEKVKELKKNIIGEPLIKKKRKQTKGPNPLSCKKKKSKQLGNNGAFGKIVDTEKENVIKKRRRKKKMGN